MLSPSHHASTRTPVDVSDSPLSLPPDNDLITIDYQSLLVIAPYGLLIILFYHTTFYYLLFLLNPFIVYIPPSHLAGLILFS